ncbi:MAG: DegT/DnrJ/EryC1/StrS family aminotransferase [Planctomycetes bacterium]|nr:DegT/DnrJ/EryC1/StrS family aminotransferase [Planctomycetota bacterium]
MTKVAMLDLQAEYRLFSEDIRSAANAVLDSQQFINGPAVMELERQLAERVGASHAIAVSSGSDAISCALLTLEIGVGDEVILPSFTFFATAGAVARSGAKPVFVDIDPRTFNLDPAKIEAAITDQTRAIMVVHLFGQCAEMEPINEIAKRHGLSVIEDAAQALGAKYHGKPACALGDLACVSFYPTKNLGGFGEGGMVFARDEQLAVIARQLRNHGESERYIHERVGGNFRLDTMKAAILLVKLRHWDQFTARRRANAARYDKLLQDSPVTTPHVAGHQYAVYHQYSILGDRRDELRSFLGDRGVQSGVYYPIPLHLQKCFAYLGYTPGTLPITEDVCTKILSLPCHPMLAESDPEYVAASIREFYAGSSATCARCGAGARGAGS